MKPTDGNVCTFSSQTASAVELPFKHQKIAGKMRVSFGSSYNHLFGNSAAVMHYLCESMP